MKVQFPSELHTTSGFGSLGVRFSGTKLPQVPTVDVEKVWSSCLSWFSFFVYVSADLCVVS